MARLIKFVGSKESVLDDCLAHLYPSGVRGGRFLDLMCGSGTVGLAVAALGLADEVHLCDASPHLTGLLRAVREHPGLVEVLVRRKAAEYNRADSGGREAMYYAWRSQVNGGGAEVPMAAILLLLNRTGFNGLYRVNGDGLLNVSWGKRADASEDAAVLGVWDAHRAMRRTRTEVHHVDFTVAPDPGPGDVVFADPPYDEQFQRYGPWWGPEDLTRLAAHLRR